MSIILSNSVQFGPLTNNVHSRFQFFSIFKLLKEWPIRKHHTRAAVVASVNIDAKNVIAFGCQAIHGRIQHKCANPATFVFSHISRCKIFLRQEDNHLKSNKFNRFFLLAYLQEKLEKSAEQNKSDPNKPHPQELCDKCKRMGRFCGSNY